MRILLLLVVLAGCGDAPVVGNVCVLEGEDGATLASSPAIECEAKTCLKVRGAVDALCTAECSSADDCNAFAETPCEAGFVCAVPFAVGDQACQRMCVCADDAANLPPDQCSE